MQQQHTTAKTFLRSSYRNLELGVDMDLCNALNSTGPVAYIVDGAYNTGSNYKVNVGELVIKTRLFFFRIK